MRPFFVLKNNTKLFVIGLVNNLLYLHSNRNNQSKKHLGYEPCCIVILSKVSFNKTVLL